MSLASKLSKVPSPKKRTETVWEGPNGTGPNGGVTYSALCRFLNCRERFRLLMVEGLRPVDAFNHRIHYGLMWHVCEEALAGEHSDYQNRKSKPHWEFRLTSYCQDLCRKYPLQQQEIDKWWNVCKVQFPLYVDFWAKHPDVTQRTPLLQEQVFNVPYKLPSGRTVRLRGKWDSVDLIGRGKCNCGADRTGPSAEAHDEGCPARVPGRIYLQENKTKSDIREQQMVRQLSFDLQTMLYLVALREYRGMIHGQDPVGNLLKGVRYNVIRRPLSGGKGTIVQRKPTKSNPQGESKESYFDRLKGIIEDEPETYFYRWKVEITPADVLKFRQQCLDPILEQLCDWWRDQQRDFSKPFDGTGATHYRHPFGVWNVLDEGGSSDLDTYLESGSEAGLHRVEQLFTELT